MRILFLSPSVTDTCSFYRSGGIAPELAKKMNCTIDVHQWDKVLMHWQMLLQYDLAMMQRPFGNDAVSLARYLKDLNIPLWVDYDDNLFAVPPENPQFELYNVDTRENMKQIIKMADVVSVATEELGKVLSVINPEIKVIPNAFNDYLFKKPEIKQGRSKTIAWRGSDTHIMDVMTWGGVINKLTEELSEWQFLFLGFNPYYLKGRNNLFHMKPMDVIHYFLNMKHMAPTLLHVPLKDIPFNKAKSNIAWIEATYFGGLCLGPEWPEWQKPGCLIYATQEDYYNAVMAVAKGEINVQAEVIKSWDYIRSELFLSKVNVKRMELINSLL